MLVTPASFPAKTLSESIAHLKANPGKVDIASSGPGSGPHIAGELFQLVTGTKMQHVPYKGSYMPDLIAGQVQALFLRWAQALSLIQEGKLRALGVTYTQRTAVLPDVPAIGEVVTGYEDVRLVWAERASEDAARHRRAAWRCDAQALADPAMAQRGSAKMGVDPMPMTADAFAETSPRKWKWTQGDQGAGHRGEVRRSRWRALVPRAAGRWRAKRAGWGRLEITTPHPAACYARVHPPPSGEGLTTTGTARR